ncbi:hypothetical protein SteCoe_9352 [Stentor coeruleus]|uniref:EF-hand domain-containing protein n=1 Tax=Stentor coeruleus TaxID=5963 RepID=A0A1R2CHY6_9CILI|nr:hypothetical protein SteCoe_9352 [Stentor coeruleus]
MESGTEIHLEYPVSIEAILSVSFNLEGFKSVFEFIIEVLRRHEISLGGAQANERLTKSLSDEMKDMKGKYETLEDLLKALQDSQSGLTGRVTALEAAKELREKFEQNTLENMAKLENESKETKEIISNHSVSLSEMQEKTAKQDISLAEMLEKIAKLEDEVNKNLRILESFKQDLDDMSNKMERNEKHLIDTREKVEGHGGKIVDHEKRLHKLELDMQQALKAINSLGGEVEQISKPIEPAVVQEVVVMDNTRVDMLSDDLKQLSNLLKELDSKIRGFEDGLGKTKTVAERADVLSKNLESDIKKILETLRKNETSHRPEGEVKTRQATGASHEELEQLRKALRALDETVKGKISSEDMQKMYMELKARVDDHGSRLTALEFSLKQRVLRSELDELLRNHDGGKQVVKVDDSIDASKLTALSRRIGTIEDSLKYLVLPEGYDLVMVTNILLKVQQESKDHKDKGEKSLKDLWNKFRELEEILAKKAGLDKLKELEEMFLLKLRELADEFSKRFADKSETKRALKFLEKLIKDTESMKIVRDGDDAMLARKPLGGWSCASCQKDLEKLMGKIAPYQAWNKLPYRDPADRIARAGPGFSRMLATVQPELLTGRNKHTPYNANSPPSNIEEEVPEGRPLPPVKKQGERPFTSL